MFPQIFGKYVLEHEIASGGMAVVYLATLRGAGGFEKRLVLKQIRAELASDEAFLRRFVAEAKTTVELSHPNIVPVYELGVEQGVYFIAMELAEGATLSDVLRASGPLSPEEGAYLGVEILRALDYAHRKAGVVHRDVTPRNVLIDEEGAVRLIDFGIAAPVSGESPRRERVFGSPGHMPPEQRDGGRLTPATDVFAVGALLLEAWTGRAPFRRATTEESDAAILDRPSPPSAADPNLAPLDALVTKAVAPDAAERPQTAEDFARPLREFLQSDLGDLSRRLGERVRKYRQSLRQKEKRSDSAAGGRVTHAPVTPVMGTPATPATKRIDPVTETFATREEVVEWTQRGSAFPKRIDAEAATAAGATTSSTSLRARAAVLVATVVVVSAAFALVTKRPALRVEPTAVSLSNSAGHAALPTNVPEPSSSSPESAAPVPSSAPSAEPILEHASQNAADMVSFNLTSDLPGTSVTLDGVPVGRTPVSSVRRSPGKHTVVFVSADLDEHLSTSVDAKTGEAFRILAQFRKPEPSISVVRRER